MNVFEHDRAERTPVRVHPYDLMTYCENAKPSEIMAMCESRQADGARVVQIGDKAYIQDPSVAPVTDEGKRLFAGW
jgi:hypothetical protein